MFIVMSNKIKFIIKSIAYYFNFFKPTMEMILNKYLKFEMFYLFISNDEIDFPLL